MNFNTEQGRQALTYIGQAQLESLDLGGNKLGKDDVIDDDEIQDNSDINKTNFDYSSDIERDKNSGINAGKMAQLFLAFSANSTIVTLDLNNNVINNISAAQIGLFLKENGTLETLILNDNIIGAKGSGYIADGLENNYILTQLVLDKQYEDSPGYRRIQDILLCNRMHYSETLKSHIDKIKVLDEKLNKINLNKDLCNRLYGLKKFIIALSENWVLVSI